MYEKIIARMYDEEGNLVSTREKYYGDNILGRGMSEKDAAQVVNNLVYSTLSSNPSVAKVLFAKESDLVIDTVLSESNKIYRGVDDVEKIKEAIRSDATNLPPVDKTEEVEKLLAEMEAKAQKPDTPEEETHHESLS